LSDDDDSLGFEEGLSVDEIKQTASRHQLRNNADIVLLLNSAIEPQHVLCSKEKVKRKKRKKKRKQRGMD